MRISIIVPTRNRAERVVFCINSIAAAVLPKNCTVELIVVDNNSADDTNKVVKPKLQDISIVGVYVFCAVPGSSSARNAGIKESSGDILMFLDDDMIVDQQWLAETCRLYESDKDLGMVEGRIELYNPDDLPESIKIMKEYDVLDRIGKVHSLSFMGNSSVRKEIIEKIGCFDSRLGAGTLFHAGEDTDFVYRARKADFRIIYSPDVLAFHNHGRNTASQVRDLRKKYTIGRGAFYAKHLLRRDWRILGVLRMHFYPPLRKLKRGPNRILAMFSYLKRLLEWGRLLQGRVFVREVLRI